MKAIVQNGDYFCDEINLDFPCEIHITRFGLNWKPENRTPIRIPERNENREQQKITFENKDAYKVFVCSNEPTTSSSRELNDVIIDNVHQYDLVLASHPDIIENTDNAIFFPYGGTWLNKKPNSDLNSSSNTSYSTHFPSLKISALIHRLISIGEKLPNHSDGLPPI